MEIPKAAAWLTAPTLSCTKVGPPWQLDRAPGKGGRAASHRPIERAVVGHFRQPIDDDRLTGR